jgi:D-psicose/D-tagatose/L-ribulose 3-epimerase
MKLAVSSIAWTNDEDVEVAVLLQGLGVKYIELAPTKKWQDPTKAPAEEVAEHLEFWKKYGIEVVAFQSMLFPRPDLKIFESDENRAETLAYLGDFIKLAGTMGARVMVFGSPKNRQRGDLPLEKADAIAAEFFGKLGDAAREQNVAFCIEPNPTDYACDYVTNARQGIELVKAVGNMGFGLHLDIAGMTLAGDDIAKSITDGAPLLRHFHISSPFLEQVGPGTDVHHEEAAAALRAVGYDRYVSIEMKPGEAGSNAARVRTAVEFAQGVYGD